MVPSLAAVDGEGAPLTPGLLYGDERGRDREGREQTTISEAGEALAFMRWCQGAAPDAAGFWPAQAVANRMLSGEALLDPTTAATTAPLFDWNIGGWSDEVAGEVGVTTDQLPRLAPTGQAAAHVGADGPPLAPGCIDAFAEQLVSGADADGDVLIILGTTL